MEIEDTQRENNPMNCQKQRHQEEGGKKQIRVVPILRQLKQQRIYMLVGDLIVDLDFYNDEIQPMCQLSALNSFKNPIRVEFMKECSSNEIDLTISQDSIKQFGKIVEILEKYPNQQVHDFGILLKHYQHFVDGQLIKAALFQGDKQFESLIPAFNAEFELFLKQARIYLKNHLNQNKWNFYMFVKSNMVTFTHDITRIGISGALCQLLGGTNEQIATLILRRGLFEFFTKQTRNNFYFSYLSLLLFGHNSQDKQQQNKFENSTDIKWNAFDKEKVQSNCRQNNGPQQQTSDFNDTINHRILFEKQQISLVTLDGIEFKVNYSMDNYYGENAKSNVLFWYPHMVVVITFDITEPIVKQVINTRESLDSEKHQMIQEIEEDIYYFLESQVFLENYYSEHCKNILNNQGKSLPKEKRKYKKHSYFMSQIDSRKQNSVIISKQEVTKDQKEILSQMEEIHQTRPIYVCKNQVDYQNLSIQNCFL